MDFKSHSLDAMKMLAEIAKDALELSPPQRLLLARLLLDASEGSTGSAPEAEAAWEEEICRRMKAVQDGTAQARGLDEVLVDLDRRFPSWPSASSPRRSRSCRTQLSTTDVMTN